MISLIIALIFSASIGYLSQTTGLCMVRGVGDWMNGRPIRLLAILGTGFWVYLYFPLLNTGSFPMHLQRFELHWGFLLGGFIFGIGTAANGACSISTVSRLSSGDTSMLFTLAGWLAGWLLLDLTGFQFNYSRLELESSWLPAMCWALLGMLLIASAYVYLKHRKGWRIWSGIMLVGILAGAVFVLQPAWSPSDFVRDLGVAVLTRNPAKLPAFERIAILAMMLLGMGIAAWRYRRFKILFPDMKGAVKHFTAGTLMGAGAAAALGGNDFQLLLAIPALSLAGLLAIIGIVLGVRIGMIFTGNQSPPAFRKPKPAPVNNANH